jgi:hypothetical protein
MTQNGEPFLLLLFSSGGSNLGHFRNGLKTQSHGSVFKKQFQDFWGGALCLCS